MPSRRNSLTFVLAMLVVLGLSVAPAYAAKSSDPGTCGTKKTVAAAGGLPVAAIPSKAICIEASLNPGDIGGGVKKGVECVLLQDCPSLLPTSPSEVIGGIGGKVVGEVASSVGETALDGMASWIGKGVAWLSKKVYNAIQKSTTPVVTAKWFKTQYQNMLSLSVIVAIFTTLLAALSGIRQGRAGAFFRAALADLPIAFLITAGAVTVTQTLLLITDSVTLGFTQSFGDAVGSMMTDIVKFSQPAASASGTPATPVAVTFLLTLLIGIGTFMVWLELIVREAAVYLALLFLPLGMMSAIHPAIASLRGKLMGLLGLVIGSKFVIVFVFCFGAVAISHAGKGTDGVTQVLAGAVIMLLAAVAPMIILKMVSLDQVGDAHGHVPGTAEVNAHTPSASNIVRQSRSGFGGSSGGGGPEAGPGVGGGGGGMPSPAGGGGGSAAGGATAGAAVAGPLAAVAAGAKGAQALGANAISSASDVAGSGGRPGAGGVIDSPGPTPSATPRDGEKIPRPAFLGSDSETSPGGYAAPNGGTAAPTNTAAARPQVHAPAPTPPRESRPLPHMTRSPLNPNAGELPSV